MVFSDSSDSSALSSSNSSQSESSINRNRKDEHLMFAQDDHEDDSSYDEQCVGGHDHGDGDFRWFDSFRDSFTVFVKLMGRGDQCIGLSMPSPRCTLDEFRMLVQRQLLGMSKYDPLLVQVFHCGTAYLPGSHEDELTLQRLGWKSGDMVVVLVDRKKYALLFESRHCDAAGSAQANAVPVPSGGNSARRSSRKRNREKFVGLSSEQVATNECRVDAEKLATIVEALQDRSVPVIDELALRRLQDMGFSEPAATRALLANQHVLDAALNWLLEHGSDPDINQPLDPDEVAHEAQSGPSMEPVFTFLEAFM